MTNDAFDLSNLGKPRTKEESEPEYVKPPYLYPDPRELLKVLRSGEHVLGEPAASLTWGIDGNRDVPSLESGKEGEKQTAGILREFAESHRGAFVFHSLSWPESRGDTDHLLLYRDYALIIDSKRWKEERTYSVTDKGEVIRGRVKFEGGQVHIGSALGVWRKRLPRDMTVRGIVTIAQEKVHVVRDKNWYSAGFRLVEAEKLPEYLAQVTAKAQGSAKVKLSTLLELGSLLVAPRSYPKIKF